MPLAGRIAAVLALLLTPAVSRADSYGHASPFSTPLTKQSTHFVIHYDDAGDAAIDEARADEFLNRAEAAYATETGALGMPAPMADNDGKTDLYIGVYEVPGGTGHGTTVADDTSADQTTSWIALNPNSFAITPVVAHEFMHVLQLSIFAHQALWVEESSAQWAAERVPGAVAAGELLPFAYLGASQVPLDHSSTSYQQWPFFESVAERLGDDWVRKLYERSAFLAASEHTVHPLEAIDDVTAAMGSSLAAEYDAYALRNLDGSYSFAPLAGVAAHTATTVPTVSSAPPGDRTLGELTTTLHHLSAVYVRYANGDTCRTGETLHLSTTLPAGVPGRPAFRDHTPTTAAVAPFAISGASASLDTPWDPCSHEGTLMLDNASATLDDQGYEVAGRITYAAPVAPAQPAVPDTSEDPGPTVRKPHLTPHFPKRFVVSRRHRVLALKLSLTRGPVQLSILLAPKITKTVALKRGTSTVKLRLPSSLRAGIHRLTLITRPAHGSRTAPAIQRIVWAVRISFKR